MLSPLLSLALLLPQGGFEQAPRGMTVVVVNVGQGSATVVRAPDGTVHVVDGGPDAQGSAAVNPVIAALAPSGYGVTVATHYHDDHIGGLDEVLSAFPFQTAYDRGNQSRPSWQGVQNYLAAAGNRRRTPVEGQTIALGGGATLRFLALNGRVQGGTQVGIGGTAQEENARSIAARLDYGDFSLWIGGDLTGGGNGTADVESPASTACGDVDVYVANHHGSNTSTNTNLVNRLRPELATFSVGSNNGFGHPTNNVVNRLNQAAASIALMATSEGDGNVGFAVTGKLTLETDGERYRVTAVNGEFLDFFVDEVTGRAPTAQDLRISELHRDPARVPDANGEYFEITNVGGTPVSLRGVQVSTQSGIYTVAADVMAVPGRPLVLLRDGYAGRNGGLPLGLVWPFGAISLGNGSDSLGLRLGFTPLDTVSYTSGFPGGSGVAAERRDLLGPSSAANFAAAVRSYGLGDRGTPGQRNTADITAFPARMVIESVPGSLRMHGSALSHGGTVSVLALAYSNTPGFNLLGTPVPLAFDPLLLLTFQLPGFFGSLPAEGYRSFRVLLPSPNAATGVPAYGAHVVISLIPLAVPAVSPAVPFAFP